MGSVDEPYLAGTPDVSIFLPRLIFQGFTFGEAAYTCQNVLSWQTTCVGDPLYRPFGSSPEALHMRLAAHTNSLVEWSFLRLVNLNLASGKPLAEGVAFLEQLPTTTNSPVLTEKLGDLYAQQGKPSSSIHSYQEALRLRPSHEQQIRILLNLGDKLTAEKQDKEAYEAYNALLRDAPDYQDKLTILQKLVPLARKLDRTAEAEKFEAQIKTLAGNGKS
jgi:tetratricopeptide (TPR) repeat protein